MTQTHQQDATPIAVSEELFTDAGGQRLCYQTFGRSTDQALLLVMGLSGPMTWWDDALCEQIARAGFFVVRFDNRDIGRSGSGVGHVTRRMLVSSFLGRGTAPYSLDDMAADGFGLLDHLGIDKAVLVGVSMGGMIVQTMAIAHPERVAALVSIMSTTGRRTVGWQHPSILPRMLARAAGDREGYVERSLMMSRLIGSPGFPADLDEQRVRASETYDRGVEAAGVSRQMLAILTQPDRTGALRRLRIPAAVIHGRDDRMVHPSGGRATARAIPGAELVMIDGMGHDLPVEVWDRVVGVIRRTADRAATA